MDFDMDTLIQYVTMYGVDILAALAIFLLGKWGAKIAMKLATKAMHHAKVDETLVSFASNIVYGLVLVFVVIAALNQLGIQTASLVAVLATAGLAIGLALKDSLSNFAAGVMIIIFRPFKLGDYIEAAGIAGSVEAISIFTTTIKTPDNKTIIVPNSPITTGNVVNYSTKPTRRVDLVFGCGYGDDILKVKKVLQSIIDADDRVLKDPAPTIALAELGDSSVNFVVRPWVKTSEYWDVRFDLHEKVKLAFDKEGISIPFPQRDVHLYTVDAKKTETKSDDKK